MDRRECSIHRGVRLGGTPLALSLLILSAQLAPSQPPQVVPSAGVVPTSIWLSESTQLTLTLVGPAPLQVELPEKPEQLLTAESALAWQIRPTASAAVKTLPDGREEWTRPYRLSPYLAAEKVPIAFAPIKVRAGSDANAQEVTWPAGEVRVQTRINELKGDNARSITGIEELPAPPQPHPAAVGWQFIAGLGSVFAVVLAWAIVRKWRAKPPPLPPTEWAARELDRLERDLSSGHATGRAVADRIADVVREFVERRYGLPARKLTTAELLTLTECERVNWPSGATTPLRGLLDRCDRAKFAAEFPDEVEAEKLIGSAREWVASDHQAATTPS